MAQANVFPAFISVGLDNNSSGFGDFRSAAADAGGAVKRQFERDMGEVKRTIVNALTLPKNSFGALDLNTAGMRQAAAEAQAAAVATRQFADAAEAAARSSGDLSAQTRTFVTAARAEAVAAEEKARSLAANANAYEKLQTEMDRASVSSGRLTNEMQSAVIANGRLAASQGALRQASIGAGQQLQDIAISLYGGQKAGVVFAQQLPQLAFALSALDGSTNKAAASIGRFATFLSGPWGLAVGLGVGVLATLTAGLFDNAEASDAAENAHKGLEKRLSDMSTFFDMATGAVLRQNQALIANAQLKRLDEIDDLKKAQTGRYGQIQSLVEGSMPGRVNFGGTFGNETGRVNIRRSGQSDIVAAIQAAGGDQQKIGAALLQIARGNSENAERARNILNLRGESFSAGIDIRNLSLEEESLRTGKLAEELTKPKATPRARTGRGGGDKELRAARAIEAAVDSASDAVSRLRGQFDAAPRDIDKAAQASIELDNILTKIDRRAKDGKLTDAEKKRDAETRKQIEDLQTNILPTFKQRPVVERIEAADKELQLQRLLLQGRDEEADKLGLTLDLMRQLGVHTEAQLQTELQRRGISKEQLDLMYQQAEQAHENDRIMARMDRSVRSSRSQIAELGRAYSSIEQSVASLPDDAQGALKSLVGNLRQQVNDIIARRMTDSLFGNLFAELEGELRGKKPIDAATTNYVESTVRANTALIDLTETFIYASSAFRGVANDNALSAGKGLANSASQILKVAAKSAGNIYDPNAEIVVTGNRSKSKIDRQQQQIADAMEKSSRSLRDIAKSALEGAFIGQTASGLVLGSKGSSTGSAIGGALGKIAGDALGKTIGGTLGNFAGPLGSIAGGLLGGVVGGMFKKNRWGTAGLCNGRLLVAASSMSFIVRRPDINGRWHADISEKHPAEVRDFYGVSEIAYLRIEFR